MTNLDERQQQRMEIMQRMADAVRNDNTEAFLQAYQDMANDIEQNLVERFENQQAAQDTSILQSRGLRVLTSAENKFYTDICQAMRSDNPRQALTNVSVVLPDTTIDAVFEDMVSEHPLLSLIDLQNTGALVKYLMSTTGGVAKWGAIDATVDSELSANFIELDLTLASLTAFIPVPRYMLDMGPAWLERYVRMVLTEAIAVQLEVGVIDGNGKDQPIGMDRQLTGAVDGVYKLKAAKAITNLDPVTYGGILSTLAQGPNGKQRQISEVIFVVNPADYYTKIFPATTVRTADGTYANNVYPFPTRTIMSPAVPVGKAVMGIGKKYFMGIGAGTNGGRIEFDDSYKFLERQRVYLSYLYGYGRATDENAFVYLDISGITPTVQEVVVNEVKGTVTTKAAT